MRKPVLLGWMLFANLFVVTRANAQNLLGPSPAAEDAAQATPPPSGAAQKEIIERAIAREKELMEALTGPFVMNYLLSLGRSLTQRD